MSNVNTQTVRDLLTQTFKVFPVDSSAATLTSLAIGLEGFEAILANRLITRGSDPLSLALVLTNGEPAEYITRAHFNGPGVLDPNSKEGEGWLLLASQSVNEALTPNMTILDRIVQFVNAITFLRTATDEQKTIAINTAREIIKTITYETREFNGVPVRLYTNDWGSANAYWDNEEFFAFQDTDGNIFIGSNGRPLEEAGIKVDKNINDSPKFGIIFPEKTPVEAVSLAH